MDENASTHEGASSGEESSVDEASADEDNSNDDMSIDVDISANEHNPAKTPERRIAVLSGNDHFELFPRGTAFHSCLGTSKRAYHRRALYSIPERLH